MERRDDGVPEMAEGMGIDGHAEGVERALLNARRHVIVAELSPPSLGNPKGVRGLPHKASFDMAQEDLPMLAEIAVEGRRRLFSPRAGKRPVGLHLGGVEAKPPFVFASIKMSVEFNDRQVRPPDRAIAK